ncbi:hypothetical protein ACQ4N7_18815 [Nodosilinea sp. AN01ver1]
MLRTFLPQVCKICTCNVGLYGAGDRPIKQKGGAIAAAIAPP